MYECNTLLEISENRLKDIELEKTINLIFYYFLIFYFLKKMKMKEKKRLLLNKYYLLDYYYQKGHQPKYPCARFS